MSAVELLAQIGNETSVLPQHKVDCLAVFPIEATKVLVGLDMAVDSAGSHYAVQIQNDNHTQ